MLVLGIAAAANMVVLPLPFAQGSGLGQVDESGTTVTRIGHHKELSCAQRAHERVKALMAGLPWASFDVRPSARNRSCKQH
jgi:hypothetical protein